MKRFTAFVVLVLGVLALAGTPAQAQPLSEVETLRLACATDVIDGPRGVLCQWSRAENRDVRGYELYRIADGSARQLVATVGREGRLAHVDTDVARPMNLVYGVVARNHAGRVVGVSNPVRVELGADLERLRLACAPDHRGDQRGILCRWSPSESQSTRGYVLYRSVESDRREVIAQIGLDGPLGFFDTEILPAATHFYWVVSVDGAGSVVGTGGPVRVVWPQG